MDTSYNSQCPYQNKNKVKEKKKAEEERKEGKKERRKEKKFSDVHNNILRTKEVKQLATCL